MQEAQPFPRPSTFGVALFAMLQAFSVASSLAGESEQAKTTYNRLNPTGRTITMPIPLKSDSTALGEVVARINPDDTILIDKTALSERLARVVNGRTRASLEAIPGRNGFVSIPDLRAAGFDMTFDPKLLEMVFLPSVEQRPINELNLGHQRSPRISSNLTEPALLAGYVNVSVGADYQWGPTFTDRGSDDFGGWGGHIELDSAIRWGNIVIENYALYDGLADLNLCPAGAICDFDHSSGLKRRSSRLVYDMPEQDLRLELGDVATIATGLQRSPEILGFSLEKSARKLSPGENLQSIGQRSFRLDRPSDVDVVVNGIVLHRLRLGPGIHDIRDLPLTAGANDIQLVITDDSGNRRTLASSLFFDDAMLAAGQSEWALSGGMLSYLYDSERIYTDEMYMGSGFYRYGLSDDVTGELDLQGDSSVVMGGLGSIVRTPWGIVGLYGAASACDAGFGGAVNLDWSVTNFTGIASERGESMRFSAEFRSADFHAPGEFLTTASGIFYPEWNYWLRLDASYSWPIGWGASATLSGRYAFASSQDDVILPYEIEGDRYGIDLTISHQLTPTISSSLILGYSNEAYLRGATFDIDGEPEFRIGLRFNIRPDDRTSLAAGYDALAGQFDASGFRSEGNGLGRWEASIEVQQNDFDSRAATNGTIAYYGNRAEARLTQTSVYSGISSENFDPVSGDQRTSLRVGTAIAFADGHVAVGPPIRGGAFALVYPHDTIAEKEITVGSNGETIARADGWGPAVVSNLPAYIPSTVPVDAADLPVGYSLGAGAFDIYAPYRAGFALEVGSDYSVSAYGRLLSASGEPLALLTGVIRPVGNPTKQVAIFTNADGKFGVEGLAPGRWIVEMATDEHPTTYAIEVPKGTDGLFKAGTLQPSRRS